MASKLAAVLSGVAVRYREIAGGITCYIAACSSSSASHLKISLTVSPNPTSGSSYSREFMTG
ncbi:hypothetical protein C6341_g27504 [Phytophthora cactorum]|nr:hypothetical protein C6341_g27504 [Phytophthora cactorum]